MKYLISFFVFCFIYFNSSAQLPVGVPTQKINGWAEANYYVPDSGAVAPKRDTLWVPRFPGTMVTWYHAGVDTAVWFWNSSTWNKLANAGNVITQNIANASLKANGTYLQNWNHDQLLFDTVNWFQVKGFENDATFSTRKTKYTLKMFPDFSALPLDFSIQLRNVANNADSLNNGFFVSGNITTLSAIAAPASGTLFAQAKANANSGAPNVDIRAANAATRTSFITVFADSIDVSGAVAAATADSIFAFSKFKSATGSNKLLKIPIPVTGGAGTVTSVGLTMPTAFTVTSTTANPITTNGTFNVTANGTSAQYIKGNGVLGTTDTSMIPSFFTKVRSLFSGTSPITYSSATGAIGILRANTSGQLGAATFSNSDFTDNGSGLISLRTPVPTWQQTLTAGSALTVDNTVTGGGNSLLFNMPLSDGGSASLSMDAANSSIYMSASIGTTTYKIGNAVEDGFQEMTTTTLNQTNSLSLNPDGQTGLTTGGHLLVSTYAADTNKIQLFSGNLNVNTIHRIDIRKDSIEFAAFQSNAIHAGGLNFLLKGLPQSASSTDSVLVITGANRVAKRAQSAITSAVTLQQAMINGSTLTQNNTVDISGHDFKIAGTNDVGYYYTGFDMANGLWRAVSKLSAGATDSMLVQLDVNNGDAYVLNINAGNNLYNLIDAAANSVQLNSSQLNNFNHRASFLTVDTISITIENSRLLPTDIGHQVIVGIDSVLLKNKHSNLSTTILTIPSLPHTNTSSDSVLVSNSFGRVSKRAQSDIVSGLTSLNTLTASIQTFATGTSGSDFNISSSTSTHTFNIPSASTSNRGLVTISSQTFGGNKTFNDGIIVTSSANTPRISVTGNFSTASEPGIAGVELGMGNFTYTDNGASRTVSQGQNISLIGQPTITSGNAITYSGDASTVRFVGAPVAAGSMTISHPWNIFANNNNYISGIAFGLNEQNTSASLGDAAFNVFAGTTATYTLPALSTWPGKIYYIKNAGSGNLTVSRAGSDNLYTTTSVTTITVAAGASVVILAGSAFWYVM